MLLVQGCPCHPTCQSAAPHPRLGRQRERRQSPTACYCRPAIEESETSHSISSQSGGTTHQDILTVEAPARNAEGTKYPAFICVPKSATHQNPPTSASTYLSSLITKLPKANPKNSRCSLRRRRPSPPSSRNRSRSRAGGTRRPTVPGRGGGLARGCGGGGGARPPDLVHDFFREARHVVSAPSHLSKGCFYSVKECLNAFRVVDDRSPGAKCPSMLSRNSSAAGYSLVLKLIIQCFEFGWSSSPNGFQ